MSGEHYAPAATQRTPSDRARETARNTILWLAIIGVSAIVVGVVISISAAGNGLSSDDPFADSGDRAAQGLGLILAAIGGALTWFSMTAWAVWAGVQAARR